MEALRFTDSVRAAQQNDERAFEFLYKKSYAILKRETLKYFKNEFDADDVLQNTYISIFRNLGALKDPEKFIPWSISICRNFCINECVRKAKQKERNEFRPAISEEGQEGLDTLPASSYDRTSSPDAAIDAIETKRLLSKMLDILPEMQRTCILLWQEEYSTKEIAKMVQIPEGTVKSNVSYAKKKIKEQVLTLEKQGTKLYGMAPIPFFLWIIRQFCSSYEPEAIADVATGSFSAIAKSIEASSVSVTGGSVTAAGTASKAAVAGAAKVGGGFLTKGIVAGLITTLAVGGVAGGIAIHNVQKRSISLHSTESISEVSMQIVTESPAFVLESDTEQQESEMDISDSDNAISQSRWETDSYVFTMPDEWQGRLRVENAPDDSGFKDILNIYYGERKVGYWSMTSWPPENDPNNKESALICARPIPDGSGFIGYYSFYLEDEENPLFREMSAEERMEMAELFKITSQDDMSGLMYMGEVFENYIEFK